MAADQPILEVRGLKKHFPVSRREGLRLVREYVRAVDGIDLDVHAGATVGLVGESGCGKSTAGRTILRLIEPTAGSVRFGGVDLSEVPRAEMRHLRASMGIVFQDPMSALNPRMSVGDIVAEPLRVHGIAGSRRDSRRRARHLLEIVGLRAEHADRYPHEFSGGQRQRIGIARAIATEPRLIILDEPISALDVSIRAQILNLLAELQEQLGPAYLMIAHDLSVVRHACSRVAVMYLGVIIEEASSDELFAAPLHPYSRALLASVPCPDPAQRATRALLDGDVPTPVAAPSGCRFRARCPIARQRCAVEEPALTRIQPSGADADADAASGPARSVACHYPLSGSPVTDWRADE